MEETMEDTIGWVREEASTIPPVLRSILTELGDADAEELRTWLDDTPDAVSEMIDILCDSHPELD